MRDFVIKQVSGITSFIIAANLSGHAVSCFGHAAIIRSGTLLSAAGGVLLCVYGAAGGPDPAMIALLFVPLAQQLIAAGGTVAAAPVIESGLLPLAVVATTISPLALPAHSPVKAAEGSTVGETERKIG